MDNGCACCQVLHTIWRRTLFQTLLYDVTKPVARITLNRPERLNAYNTAMMNDIVAAFDAADADDDVGAIVLTGAGRAFCAGADISEGAGSFEQHAADPARAALRVGDVMRDGGGVASLRIFESRKPVVAAINGAAVGVGATVLLPCDVRLASTEARFGFVFTRRGLVPEAASSWFLPRIVGISRALEWTMAGRMVSAEEALQAGLVRALCAPDRLLDEATALAQEFATAGSRVAVSLTRQMMWRMLGASHPMEAHRVDSRAIMARRGAPDTREGVQAFVEKRAAVFTERVSDGLPDIWPDGDPPLFY